MDINEMVKETVFVAIKEYDKIKCEKSKKKVLHNTKLLLRHYNELKNHSTHAVYKHMPGDKSIRPSSADDMYSDDEVFIETIKKSKFKTTIMINHIDMALDRVKEKQHLSGTEEKYEALKMFYIDKIRKDDIAAKLNCSTKSVSRWVKEAEEDVSINLFGVNSIEHLFY